MAAKLTIVLKVRDPQTKRIKEARVSSIVETPDLIVMRALWDAERAINDHTPVRCHISVEGVPNTITKSAMAEDDSTKNRRERE